MKKIFVFLGLSLLCWGSSFAQEKVDPEAIQSYSDLTTVIKNIADAPVLKNKYDAAVAEYNRISAIPKPPATIMVDVPVETKRTSPLVTAINNFVTSKNAADESGIITPNQLSYRIRVIKADRTSDPEFYLYVTYPDYTSFVDTEVAKQDVTGTSKFNKWKDDAWTTTDMTTLRNALADDNAALPYELLRSEGVTTNATPSQMIVCYAKYEKNGNTVSEVYSSKPIDQTSTKNITYFFQSSWIDKLSAIASTPSLYGLEVTSTEIKQEEKDNSAAVNKWNQDIANAKTAKDNAEAAWKAINKGDFYLNAANVFKITSNIDFPTTGYNTTLEWPANRKLDGQNHMYTGKEQPLLKYNRGEIYNMIAPYTDLVTKNIGDYSLLSDCIAKTGDSEYTLEKSNKSYTFASLKTAVYQLRNKFGFNVETNEATGPAERTTKLYEAKYTDAQHKDLYTFHVNLAEQDGAEAFKYNKAQAASDNRLASGIKRENTVIYINNTDVPDDVKAWNNVATRNNIETEKYTCQNVELVDGNKENGTATEEFYVPTSFAFENIIYGRAFKEEMTALCLPFKLDANVKAALEAQGGQNIYYYTFKEVKGKTMWFNIVENVAENTPCIIAYTGTLNTEQLFKNLKLANNGTPLPEFASTNGATLGATASNSGELCFFGNYKFGQFANDLQILANGGKGACIYGFQKGKLRLMPEATPNDKGVLEGPRLHQFRSYIRLEADLTGNTAAPNSFNIGLLDEDGNVVTGIESVESGKEANGFKAVGGNSAIEISTDKACEVKVYTASGSLVKAVRVEAGNTTLPFGAGMYIVNQTKVVVK